MVSVPLVSGVVARDDERALIGGFLDAGPAVAALVLGGEAGIGKTALWEWAVDRAARAGHRVLVSRASPAEARLPWVVVADLLAAVPASAIETLPPPQRRVLRVVTLQEEPEEPLDERAVGTALLAALTALATAAPVLLAIDDLPCTDAASAGALRFALRRLAGVAVRLVTTVRDATGTRAGLGPAPPLDGVAPDAIHRVDVGPMSVAALYDLLATRLGVRLPRPVLVRVHETSGGNPLYAMELARALDRLEIRPVPGLPLAVPTGLQALVADRVASLPADVLSIAAGTAACWRFTDSGLDPDALAAAVRAGVASVEPSPPPRVVRPMHPLLSAAAYTALDHADRRALHERLAAGANDPVERARHTALATPDPSSAVAGALDAGVVAALAAGTPDIAVDLARLALDRTLDDADRPTRLDRLADALMRAGDAAAATEAQRQAVGLTAPGPPRATRRIRLAEFLVEADGWAAAESDIRLALAEAVSDPTVHAEALVTLASITDDIDLADASAREALRLIESVPRPDPVVLAASLSAAAGTRFRAGRGLDHGLCQRAIELQRGNPQYRLSDRAEAGYAALLKYADQFDEAETRLVALLEQARSAGDLTSIAYALGHLPQIAVWRGELETARCWAEEHLAVAEQGQLTSHLAQAKYNMGYVLAHLGQLDEARRMLYDMRDSGPDAPWFRQRAAGALGFVELSASDAVAAVTHLDEWHAILTDMGFREPGYSRSHLDYLCALTATGRLDDARTVIARLADQATTSGRESAQAVVRTGRALILVSEGDALGARVAIEAALSYYDTSPLRFDRARTLLIAGQVYRRTRAKTLAHNSLTAAAAAFHTFGAVTWEARAIDELTRVNLRPTAPTQLTATERRVADLAASGLTNREVADRMFMSVKTVESNLVRVYRKLGIRSRAEVGLRLHPPG